MSRRSPYASLSRAATLLALTLLVPILVAAAAYAGPPMAGSEDYDGLMPFAGWIATQATNKGGLCCSVSDCRIVKYRTHDAVYEAFVANADERGFTKFPGAPNKWVSVPAAVIKRNINPTGQAIACWSQFKVEDGGFYCFFLPEMG